MPQTAQTALGVYLKRSCSHGKKFTKRTFGVCSDNALYKSMHSVNQLKVVGQLLNDLIDMSPVGDDRPESVDLEVMRIQNGGDTSPVPSLALTDTDFGGGRGEPDTGRSTLLRSAHQCIPLLSEFRV